MSEESKQLGITLILCIALLSAIFQIGSCAKVTNDQYWQAQQACVKSGGSWIAAANSDGHCIKQSASVAQ